MKKAQKNARKYGRVLVVAILTIFLFTPLTTNAFEYPGHSWWGIDNPFGGDEDTGLKFNGYIEQGMDIGIVPGTDWTFNIFVGTYLTVSTEESRWWDQQIRPVLGGKFKVPVRFSDGLFGNLAIGARAEYVEYLGNEAPYSNDYRLVVFITGYFGWSLFE